MWKLLLILAGFGLLAGVLAGCSSMSLSRNRGDATEEALALQIDKLARHYPALSYGATSGNGPLFMHETGFAGVAAERQMTSETPVYVFSLTKLFTSLGLLQLADRGLVDLTDEVQSYLPWVPYAGSVQHFLSHSAGVPDPIWGTFYVHRPEDHDQFDRNALLREVAEDNSEPLFKPGEGASYSNLGYAILGALIEEVSGDRWEVYIRREILDPLGMSHTGSDPTQLAGLANSYVSRSPVTGLLMGKVIPWIEFTREGSLRAIQRDYFFDLPAHGGLAIAPTDLERFVRAVVERDPALLSSTAWKSWLAPQESAGGTFTLGWHVEHGERGLVLYHSGGAMGHSAHIRIYVDEGIGTFVQTNLLDSKRVVRRDINVLDEMLFGLL